MYSSILRTEGYKSRLLRFILFEYGIRAGSIAPARRGFYGETWRLDTLEKAAVNLEGITGAAEAAEKAGTAENTEAAEKAETTDNKGAVEKIGTAEKAGTVKKKKRSYFVKLDYSPHKDIYEHSFAIVDHLCRNGIDFISKIVKTKNGRLFTRFDGAVLGVFEWIDGENTQTNESKIPEYRMLAKVYSVPYEGLQIPREDFSSKNVDTFYMQWNDLKDETVNSLLEKNRAKIEHRAGRLRAFSDLCRGDTTDFFITHGDAGGNFLAKDESLKNELLDHGAEHVTGDQDPARFHIVDWDEPLLAPPERDAWVMCSHEWARDAFHEALRRNGITYTLRPERLAYYCYRYFFFYLTSYLDALPQVGPEQLESYIKVIEEYVDSWVQDSFDYVDLIRYTGT